MAITYKSINWILNKFGFELKKKSDTEFLTEKELVEKIKYKAESKAVSLLFLKLCGWDDHTKEDVNENSY